MKKLTRLGAWVAGAALPLLAVLAPAAAPAAPAAPLPAAQPGAAESAALPVALPVAPEADPSEDPNLTQQLGDLAIATDQRTLDIGHVDMGPKFADGQWRLMIHDDLARLEQGAASVWRYPDNTVLRVADAGKLPVPADPAYEFVGAPAGSDVWVIPQTQNPQVVWLGWNTQDPQVMERIDRGVTMSLQRVQGPGVMTMYLQSGSFGEPQLLWDSRVTEPQSIWVDVNTHTHSNWVFTAPGVYLAEVKVAADLIDGSTVEDVQVLRFAVGDATTDADALAVQLPGAAPSVEASTNGDDAAAPADSPTQAALPADAAGSGLVVVLYVAIAVVALALVVGVVLTLVRSNRARQREGMERARASKQAAGQDDAAQRGSGQENK
ncbi:choice-of-anchor M domain-containing protein [Buchananella felis]|uniref:choice-of-anchor M domain-containing protein n=1 Tax=Buchananella felis TaxID=3231492 RepID=UPI003526F942